MRASSAAKSAALAGPQNPATKTVAKAKPLTRLPPDCDPGSAPSPAVCRGRGDGEQMFGDMVDRLAQTQLVPVVHRRDPRTAQRPPRVWRSGAREVPVDPPGRASWGSTHGVASHRSRAPTL